MALSSLSLATLVSEKTEILLPNLLTDFNKFTFKTSSSFENSRVFKRISTDDTLIDNDTDYTGVKATGTPLTLNLTELSRTIELDAQEIRDGYSVDDVIKALMVGFGNGLAKKIASLIPIASKAISIPAIADFKPEDASALSAELNNPDFAGIYLQPNYYTKVIPNTRESLDPKLPCYGFGYGVSRVNVALPASIVGYIAEQDSIAIATAMTPTGDGDSSAIRQVVYLNELSNMPIVILVKPTDSYKKKITVATMFGAGILNDTKIKSLKVKA